MATISLPLSLQDLVEDFTAFCYSYQVGCWPGPRHWNARLTRLECHNWYISGDQARTQQCETVLYIRSPQSQVLAGKVMVRNSTRDHTSHLESSFLVFLIHRILLDSPKLASASNIPARSFSLVSLPCCPLQICSELVSWSLFPLFLLGFSEVGQSITHYEWTFGVFLGILWV